MLRKHPLAKCEECPLKDCTPAPSFIPDNAVLAIVGEAPGAKEVALGKPFVGPSGQLMEHVLTHQGYDFDQVARLNACLCRPINNDTPSELAVRACNERLAAELASIPKAPIMALGGTASAALDLMSNDAPKGGVMARRGNWYQAIIQGVKRPYFISVHPAFILRNPQALHLLTSDVYTLSLGNAKGSTLQTDVKHVRLGHEIKRDYLEAVPSGALVALDVETTHAAWYKSDCTLLLMSLAVNAAEGVTIQRSILEDPNFKAWFNEWIKDKQVIAHNGKFDQTACALNGLHFELTHDTLLLEYAFNEQAKGHYGLKELAKRYLGFDDYEQNLVEQFLDRYTGDQRTYDKIPYEYLSEYAAIDAVATYRLAAVLLGQLAQLSDEIGSPNPLDAYSTVLIPASNAFSRVERNGIGVDRDLLWALVDHFTGKMQIIRSELHQLAINALDANPFTLAKLPKAKWVKDTHQFRTVLDRIREDFNPNSWQHVQILVFDVLGLKHVKPLGYKTDKRSTNEESLNALPPNDFVAKILEYRRYSKLKGTYAENLLKLSETDWRVHVNFNLHGTETGRLSASQGLHGIPRESDESGALIRAAFKARPGYVFVIADFSQAELRAFAAVTKDPFLVDTFNRGEDIHDKTALSAIGEPYARLGATPKERKANPLGAEMRTWGGKNIRFGIIYGGGAAGIAAMSKGKISAAQIQPILVKAKADTPIAEAWIKRQFEQARKQGWIRSRFGRLRRFLLQTNDNLMEIRKECVNAEIQGSASDINVLSIVAMVSEGIEVGHTLHDSIIAEVPIESCISYANDMAAIMLNTAKQWFPEVEWGVDVKIQERLVSAIPVYEPYLHLKPVEPIYYKEYSTLD